MRIAVLSDVHSNWEALREVLSLVATLAVERIVCLGDIVGYNADPELCLQKVLPLAEAVVRGNHDKAAATLEGIDDFNEAAREAALWTHSRLPAESLEVLKGLKRGPLLVNNKLLICHGSPMDEDRYIFQMSTVEESFRFMKARFPQARVCFFGHTHVPLVIEERGKASPPAERIVLSKDRLFLINPGSIGQPRDGVPLASFGVYEDEEGIYEHFRVNFPLKVTQGKILEQGLPPVLAYRLSQGR